MGSQDLKLDQFGEAYEVIGELASEGRASRAFMGKRGADGVDVLITVTQTPPGDEGNALSHLAADASLLAAQAHRSVIPVLESRWLDTDTFSIVTPRAFAPSLRELLTRRDEEFDYPRIATILQEVNGALDWARELKIVHRAIDLDSVYIEPGSDRVSVSFAARPLPLADMPGVEDDARTIAALARAMLTRSAADPERDSQPLAELRPGLPEKVIEQTDALLSADRTVEKTPDVRGYIATIAMADALKRGEAERERTFEFERKAFAKEKRALEDALAKEREALTAERAALAAERKALEMERAAPMTVPVPGRTRRKLGEFRLPIAATALALLIAIAALVVARRDRSTRHVARDGVSTSRVVEAAAGDLTPDSATRSASPFGVPTDLIIGVADRATAELLIEPPPRRRPRTLLADTALHLPQHRDTTMRLDTTKSVADTLRRPRPDSVLKRDSVRKTVPGRRDTVRPTPMAPQR